MVFRAACWNWDLRLFHKDGWIMVYFKFRHSKIKIDWSLNMPYYKSRIALLGLNYLYYDMMVLRAACWNRGLRLCSNHFFIRTVEIGFYFNCSYEQVWNWLVPKYILLNHNVSLLQTLIIWAFEHPAKPKWILTSQSFFMFLMLQS